MTRRARSKTARLIGAALLAGALVACGGDDLEAASEELEQMQQEVAEARATLETREAEATAANAALEAARGALAKAEERLVAARERVAKQADDALLFRAVQQRLLDESDLKGVAIAARVQQRVVTLEGTVPAEALKKRAQEVAAGTTGVQSVINQIVVTAAKKK